MSIALDHVFMMIGKENAQDAIAHLEAFGLRESYRRRHPGQGTSNICYCFHNAFFELLFLEDEAEARSAPIERTSLAERAVGKANPFGLAWRGDADIPMWDYKPPYLPEGLSIQMAVASDNHALPLLFSFPGSKPPHVMSEDRHGGMQIEAGFLRLDAIQLQVRDDSEHHAALRSIGQKMETRLNVASGAPDATMSLLMTGENRQVRLELPSFEITKID